MKFKGFKVFSGKGFLPSRHSCATSVCFVSFLFGIVVVHWGIVSYCFPLLATTTINADFLNFPLSVDKMKENPPVLSRREITRDKEVVLPVAKSLKAKMLKLPKSTEKLQDKVLILIPIHNAADYVEQLSRVLLSLSYPRHLISVAFGEDSSTDKTVDAALNVTKKLRRSFRRMDVVRLNLTGQIYGDTHVRHDRATQLNRRSHIAKARNMLLKHALQDEKWVLWIDCEVKETPPDLIQQLLSGDKDIIVPLCVQNDRFSHITVIYDKNTWRETNVSRKRAKKAPKYELLLEGYDDTGRVYLNSLRPEGRIVPLDGVGGCTLMIRASCHRKGLMFPEYVYNHHIETEGLALMAKKMGFGVFGMPFVEVVHS